MAAEKFKRKLTAILSADVKGYSRLIGEDEEGTIRTLKVYMEVITGFIQQHRGRVVATGGQRIGRVRQRSGYGGVCGGDSGGAQGQE